MLILENKLLKRENSVRGIGGEKFSEEAGIFLAGYL